MPPRVARQKSGAAGQTSNKGSGVDASNVAAAKQFFNLISLDIDVDRARQLQLRNKAITALPLQLGTVLGKLQKLDLGQNDIRNLAPLGSLPHLTNLTLSGNEALKSLETLSCAHLVVLSVANCGLESLRGLSVCRATLRALIANDNKLQLQSPTAVEHAAELSSFVQPPTKNLQAMENYTVLASLETLETIVLSRNPQLCQTYDAPALTDGATAASSKAGADHDSNASDVEEESPDGGAHSKTAHRGHESHMPADPQVRQLIASAHPLSVFEKLVQLKKMSLSECGLTSLPLRWFLPVVTELRLAKNALRSFQPDGVICRSLKILDVSHNELDALATLRRCRYLKQLNLRGNPLADHYQERDQAEGFAATPTPGTQTHTVPVTLMRSLPHLFTQLELIDGQTVLQAEALPKPHKRPREETAADELAEPLPVTGDVSPVQTATPTTHVQETRAERAARVELEEEEKDVVAEAPESVAKPSKMPVIRRERTLRPDAAAKVKVAGGAAVAKLAAQRNQTSSW